VTSKLNTTMRLRECEVLYRTRTVDVSIRHIRSSEDVYRLLRAMDATARAAESLWVLLVDARQKLIAVHECARGGISSVPVQPCDVFRAAIVAGASAVLLAHNHPSGECAPSPEDFAFTKAMRAAGALLGIPLLDHVVVASAGFYSFVDAGHMASLSKDTV
jgi:DNA repair protein RadC